MKQILLAALVASSGALTAITPAVAQAADSFFLPKLYQVTGVAADDTLNVRVGASVQTNVIDELAPGTTGVEVVALTEDGTWGKVSAAGANGWVSMAYMTEMALPGDGIPAGMTCGGTEPFWGLAFAGQTVDYADPLDDFPGLPVVDARSSFSTSFAYFGFDAATPAGRISGVVTAARCGDGMSDRDYGWKIDMIRQDANGASLMYGCCSLDQR